jgi:hypothetical protein
MQLAYSERFIRRLGDAAGLASVLAEQIEEVERSCPLAAAQKKKLELAGKGDVKRFLDRVYALGKRQESALADPEEATALLREIEALEVRLRNGLFGQDSLFSKTLARALTEDQLAKYQSDLRERRSNPYQEAVFQAVKQVGRSLDLSSEQRRRLEKVILDETKAFDGPPGVARKPGGRPTAGAGFNRQRH